MMPLAVLQWLFVLEGFPSVVMCVVVYIVLPDSCKVHYLTTN
jgi:hypothetical protein